MQDDEAVRLRLGEELRERQRFAGVRLDADLELAWAALERAHARRIVCDLGARDELAHVVKGPAVVRRLAPVRERRPRQVRRLH